MQKVLAKERSWNLLLSPREGAGHLARKAKYPPQHTAWHRCHPRGRFLLLLLIFPLLLIFICFNFLGLFFLSPLSFFSPTFSCCFFFFLLVAFASV